ELADSVHFAPRIVLKYKPRVVVLYAGDNDIAAGKTPVRVASDFRAFVRTVRKELSETKIVFLSIKPSPCRWHLVEKMRKANALIEGQCTQEKGVVYVDTGRGMLGKD